MNAISLTDRTALLTGANTGIGQAIACAMGRAGTQVLCAGRSDMGETLAALPSGRAVALDLSDPKAAAPLFDADPIDILVNNAGIIRRADAADYGEDDWDAVIDLNLKLGFFTAQAFARALITRNATGAVVNIAALQSFQGGIRVPAYTAAKHGVAGLTKALANEWAGRGINVNAIAPGYIETNNTVALRADPQRSPGILSRIPANRWGRPDDIAEVAVFLASPAAAYIHATVLAVDGGWLAR